MRITRRRVLTLTAGVCCAGLKVRAGGAPPRAKPTPIGIQLFAVRGAFSRDPAGTLKALAELGYEGVEFWGYRGGPAVFQDKDAEYFKKILDSLGLRCCGMHMSLQALQGERFAQTVTLNKTLGNRFLIVAAARRNMQSPQAIRKFARTLNALSQRAEKVNMRVGYHSHGFDFKKFNGTTAWELLFGSLRPEVVMQLDIGNCAGGGGDPLAILKKFPGRAATVHVKEYPEAPLTENSAVWKELFSLCRKLHKTKWYIVEQGDPGGTSVEIPKRALAAVRALTR